MLTATHGDTMPSTTAAAMPIDHLHVQLPEERHLDFPGPLTAV
jgi:hypothetical protein